MLANSQSLIPSFFLMLQSLENSEFEFFLTGSRFFGGATETSDYDFFVMEERGVEEYLHSNGFALDADLMYEGDPTFVKVFSLRTESGMIQVQLTKRDQFARKQLMQRLLQDRFGTGGLPGDKNHKRELWRLTYSILDSLGIS